MFICIAETSRPEHSFLHFDGSFDEWKRAALPAVLGTLGESPRPVPPDPELVVEWEDRAQRDQGQRQLSHDALLNLVAKRTIQDPGNPATAAPSAAERKEIASYRNATKRYEKYRLARVLKIEHIHQQILQNEEEKADLDKEVSRINDATNT